MHEATLNEDNCFITLTYDNKNLPSDGSLDKEHFQLFIKKYRKSIEPKRLRYYHCGEYGEQLGRPHYHAIIFGHDFDDKVHIKGEGLSKLYTGEKLEKLWGKGSVTIGSVTFESAAYVARYVLKKVTGELAQDHYERVNVLGEITDLVPEYTTMSRRPGIGREWYEKYKDEVYPDDFIIVRGKKMKPPKYYQQFFAIAEEEQYEAFKKELKKTKIKNRKDNTPARLRVREACTKARSSLQKRELE